MRTVPQRRILLARRTLIPLAAAAAPAVLPLAGCVDLAGKHGAGATLRGAIEAVDTLHIENRNGSVTVIEDATVTGAQVVAEIRCFADTEQAAAVRAEGATLEAGAGADGAGRVRVNFPEPPASQDSARIEVRVASLSALEIATSNGRVAVEGLAGPLSAQTSNGAIEITRHDGASKLESSNGRIVVKDAGGPVSARTSNGGVEISLRDGAPASVDVQTSNGAIEITLPSAWVGEITGSTTNGKCVIDAPAADGGRREVSGNLATTTVGDGTSSAKAEARTSNGAVRIRVGR